MADIQDRYMLRALQLAKLGTGATAPNPMVGAVLVYKDRIIGEGYHKRYGTAHAEVNCIQSVVPEHQSIISKATLYVTLEPCSHFGNTPPCTRLVINKKIPQVVIGAVDPNPKVSGTGIKILQETGIKVIRGIREKECLDLNRRFIIFHKKHRPYIILKWAQSPDGFMALANKTPVRISNLFTDRTVHRWRSEEAGILVGSQTALSDNPRLTNRLWTGASPKRLVIDRNNILSDDLHLLEDENPTLIFNLTRANKKGNKEWIRLNEKSDFLEQLMQVLYTRNILSVLVEGGAALLQTFINKKLWDEARVITGTRYLKTGIHAPRLSASPTDAYFILTDQILHYRNHL